MNSTTRSKWICTLIATLSCAPILRAQDTSPQMSWYQPDHPSGVYHAKDSARFSVRVENRSATSATIQGSIAFGLRLGSDDFKPLSITPVTATEIAAGQSAKIPVAVTFAGAGPYEVRWIDQASPTKSTPLENPDGVPLTCIFAPRLAPRSTSDSRWLTLLPKEAANVPGYLPDLIAQTGVAKYLLDERFAFDTETGIALGVGASLHVSSESVDRLLADAARANAQLILRLTVPMEKGSDDRTVQAFRQYIADAAHRARGSLAAIIISPENAPTDRATFRAFYLAGYAAAKAVDKKIAMLGAGTAQLTRQLLLSDDANLAQYLDAITITNTRDQPAFAAQSTKLPLWVLPPPGPDPWNIVPPASALAEGASVAAVPPPAVDRGVIEHLLGGAVLYQKLQPTDATLPYVATFQGDGFAVAAIAGLSAGTPADAALPQLAETRTVITPLTDDDKPPYPNLEVGDDSGTMRVVDAAGAPVDCRQGDTLYVPAADKFVYLLSSGTAEDLMATLRSAPANRLPIAELQAKSTDNDNTLLTKITNISPHEFAGTLRIIITTDKGPTILSEQRFPTLPPTKSLEIPLTLTTPIPKDNLPIAEIITDPSTKIEPLTQSTALRLHPQ